MTLKYTSHKYMHVKPALQRKGFKFSNHAAERAREISGPKSFTLRNRKRGMNGNVSGYGALPAGGKSIAFDFKPYPDAEARSMRVSLSVI